MEGLVLAGPMLSNPCCGVVHSLETSKDPTMTPIRYDLKPENYRHINICR